MLTKTRKRLFALLLAIATVFISVSIGQAAFTGDQRDLPGAEDNAASFAEESPVALPEASDAPEELPETSQTLHPLSDTD